jgi:hypothetical protein
MELAMPGEEPSPEPEPEPVSEPPTEEAKNVKVGLK